MSSERTVADPTIHRGSAPENYEAYFVPAIGAPLARDLVERAALRVGERVLDVACGTGIVARLAAERVGPTGAVAGLDVSPGMLEVARSVAPAEMPIDWHEASAEAMPLPDDAFDVVLCQMGLQFVPDKPAALEELRRVLRPGGRLVLNVPGPTPAPMAMLAQALATHVSAEAAAFVDVVFSLHDPPALQRALQEAGFAHVAVDHPTKTLRVPPPQEFLWHYVHSTPLGDALAQADEGTRAGLERAMVDGCAPFVTDDALTLDVGLVIAIARKAEAAPRHL